MSRLRFISSSSNGPRTAKIYRDPEWAEYRVRLYIDGILNPAADYFTDDLDDAKATLTAMLED